LVLVAALMIADGEAKGSPRTSAGQSAQVEQTPLTVVDVDPSDGIDAREASAIAEAYSTG
jgi:hypothetical protein